MKKLSSILIAGLVALPFAGEALGQTPTPPSPPPGLSAQKRATKPARKKAKAKRTRKRGKTARAPKMLPKKTQ